MLYFKSILLLFSLSSTAYAYIDPAGISSFLSLIVSSVIGFFYVFRFKVQTYLEKINFIFKDLKTLSNYLSQKKEIVFFVENKSYVPYLKSVIDKISAESTCVNIITENDVNIFDNQNLIRVYKFNLNFTKILAFNLVHCNLLVTTSPDLGTSEIKKNKNCKCYYYIFHSLVSTPIIYKDKSFKNFDLIACATSYQKKELEKEETTFQNISKKTFLEAGYPFFEVMNLDAHKSFEKNSILIAPSWNAKIENYYSKFFSEIVKKFLDNDIKVIFRPHPQYKKKNLEDLINFEKKFISNKNFIFDHSSNFDILSKVEFLLTDWSGISFEFSYINKRPVIFLEVPRKVHNEKNFLNNDLKDGVVEFSKRNEIGVVCDDTLDVKGVINELRNKEGKYLNSIENFFNSNLYENKNSSHFISKDILKRNNFFNETN